MPEDVVEHYNLGTKTTKYGYIFITIKRRMYGLSQARILAQELLEARVVKRGYQKNEYTLVLWLQKLVQLYSLYVWDIWG